MENMEDLIVNGYIFATHEDAELARNEIKKIKYIEEHTDMSNCNLLKGIYIKALETRTFCTPIGLEFMHYLHDILIKAGFNEEEIKPIPLYTTFKRINLSESKPLRKRQTLKQKKEESLKLKYRNAVLISIILGVVIIALFIITFNGTTPNALNYKQAVTNYYASWDQELKEREKAVREKERELNIYYDEVSE